MNGDNSRFTGRYRATVVSNIDPEQMGRLLVQVPDVLGSDPCFWAMPSSPVAGTQMGMYAVPPIGAGVWVEFEQGNPDYAIWTGSWRGSSAEVPAMALAAPPTNPPIVVQSITQNKIILSSVPGEGIILETAAGPLGPRIVIDATTIKITNGLSSIEVSTTEVKINGTALVIKAVV
ncbi:baseplate assembly protein [Rivularia sp. IAM M-261]|nr:baseplate assembly protein [Rivularia sp. IAM M-261]